MNAAVPDTWRKSEAIILNFTGNATNQFSDALDAWKMYLVMKPKHAKRRNARQRKILKSKKTGRR